MVALRIVIKSLSKGVGEVRKPLILLGFGVFFNYSHSIVAGGLEVIS